METDIVIKMMRIEKADTSVALFKQETNHMFTYFEGNIPQAAIFFGEGEKEGLLLIYDTVLTTIQPVLKKMTTPKMLIIHDVKTPSHVPNNTGSEIKKFDCHHGRLRDDYKQNKKAMGLLEQHVMSCDKFQTAMWTRCYIEMYIVHDQVAQHLVPGLFPLQEYSCAKSTECFQKQGNHGLFALLLFSLQNPKNICHARWF